MTQKELDAIARAGTMTCGGDCATPDQVRRLLDEREALLAALREATAMVDSAKYGATFDMLRATIWKAESQ